MPISSKRLDTIIAESERRVAEQAFRVIEMDLSQLDTRAARRTLMVFEGILAEYHHARKARAESYGGRQGREAAARAKGFSENK